MIKRCFDCGGVKGGCPMGLQATCQCEDKKASAPTGAMDRIRSFLRDGEKRPRNVKQIADATGLDRERVPVYMSYLCGNGQVKRIKRGWYVWKEYAWPENQ